jgi:hypothetical protein
MKKPPRADLKDLVEGYTACMLWTGLPDDTELGIDDIATATRAKIEADCRQFAAANAADLAALYGTRAGPEYSAAQAGHDLWLSRNRDGAGFWDRGLGDIGERLDKAAQAMGGLSLYVGDDGLLYLE